MLARSEWNSKSSKILFFRRRTSRQCCATWRGTRSIGWSWWTQSTRTAQSGSSACSL